MPTLRERCQVICDQMMRDAIMRQGSSVDTLMAFVISEKGRASDKGLEESLPCVLYFGTDRDRDEFMEVFREAKPNVITKKLP